MTKKEFDESQKTTEKNLVEAWYEVQAHVKDESVDVDFNLNLYAFSQYQKFGEILRDAFPEIHASDFKSVKEFVEAYHEAKKELDRLDKLNYQKLMQTFRYINDVRHNKNSMILTR